MDTCSDRRGRGRDRAGLRTGPGAGRKAVAAALLLGGIAGSPAIGSEASAQTFLTQEEALRLAFPEPAEIERRTAYLDEAQLARARELAGPDVEIRHTIVTYYVGRRDGRRLGTAYFDAHRVRTLPEVLMLVVSPSGTLERVEVLKFQEPPEYVASERWLNQLDGRELGPALSLKGDIINLTGATLTSRAVTAAARRILALHRVIDPGPSPESRPGARGPR